MTFFDIFGGGAKNWSSCMGGFSSNLSIRTIFNANIKGDRKGLVKLLI